VKLSPPESVTVRTLSSVFQVKVSSPSLDECMPVPSSFIVTIAPRVDKTPLTLLVTRCHFPTKESSVTSVESIGSSSFGPKRSSSQPFNIIAIADKKIIRNKVFRFILFPFIAGKFYPVFLNCTSHFCQIRSNGNFRGLNTLY